MDKLRNSTVFYASFYDSTKDLDNETFRESWEAILRYAFYGIEPDALSPIASMFFKMAKPNIDKNIQLRENGTKGGKPKKSLVTNAKPKKSLVTDTEPLVTTTETKHIYDVDEDVDVDVDEDEDVDVDVPAETIDYTNTHIPTMKEIRDEASIQKYKLSTDSIDRFVSYNRSKGWKMDWKEALKRWAEQEKPPDRPKLSPAGKFQNFERNTENIELENKIIAMQTGGYT